MLLLVVVLRFRSESKIAQWCFHNSFFSATFYGCTTAILFATWTIQPNSSGFWVTQDIYSNLHTILLKIK